MANNNVNNVSVGKPSVSGAVYRAPLGTKLPTDATTALSAAFENMGYISEDGVSKAVERSVEDIKAWGGVTVLKPQTEYSETLTVTFLESLNPNVLEAVYGEDNVSGDGSTSDIAILGNSKELNSYVWVIDTVVTGDRAYRMIFPQGKITEIGEVSYQDGEAIGYEATIACLPDNAGNCRYEYIAKKGE